MHGTAGGAGPGGGRGEGKGRGRGIGGGDEAGEEEGEEVEQAAKQPGEPLRLKDGGLRLPSVSVASFLPSSSFTFPGTTPLLCKEKASWTTQLQESCPSAYLPDLAGWARVVPVLSPDSPYPDLSRRQGSHLPPSLFTLP